MRFGIDRIAAEIFLMIRIVWDLLQIYELMCNCNHFYCSHFHFTLFCETQLRVAIFDSFFLS